MKLNSIILLSAIALMVGCTTTEEMRVKLANKTDAGLCLDWMNYPSINIWQNEREREIKRRGLDCSRYGNVSAARRRADDSLDRMLQQQADTPQQSRQPINCTTTRTGNVLNTNCY